MRIGAIFPQTEIGSDYNDRKIAIAQRLVRHHGIRPVVTEGRIEKSSTGRVEETVVSVGEAIVVSRQDEFLVKGDLGN